MTDAELRNRLLNVSVPNSTKMTKLSLENEALGPTLALWLKISTAVIIGIGAYVWTTVQASKDQNAANDKQIAVMQEQLSALAKTVEQHAALFVEVRGLIKSVEDQVRKTHTEITTLLSENNTSVRALEIKHNQILDDLHWVKAGILTSRQSEEIKSSTKNSSSSTASQASPK